MVHLEGSPPDALCSDLDSVGHSGSSYTGDIDWTAFDLDAGDVRLELTWDAGDSRYDLWVLRKSGGELETLVAEDQDEDPWQETELDWYGGTIYVGVAGWDGETGDWKVAIEEL